MATTEEMATLVQKNWTPHDDEKKARRGLWVMNEDAEFEYKKPIFGYVGKRRVYQQLTYERDIDDRVPIEQSHRVPGGIERTLQEAYEIELLRIEASNKINTDAPTIRV